MNQNAENPENKLSRFSRKQTDKLAKFEANLKEIAEHDVSSLQQQSILEIMEQNQEEKKESPLLEETKINKELASANN